MIDNSWRSHLAELVPPLDDHDSGEEDDDGDQADPGPITKHCEGAQVLRRSGVEEFRSSGVRRWIPARYLEGTGPWAAARRWGGRSGCRSSGSTSTSWGGQPDLVVVQGTLYSVLCILYSVLSTQYTVLCTLYSVLYTQYIVFSTQYSLLCT